MGYPTLTQPGDLLRFADLDRSALDTILKGARRRHERNNGAELLARMRSREGYLGHLFFADFLKSYDSPTDRELAATIRHAGGKFGEGGYKVSAGLHGVGLSVVNALSKHLECWVRRGGKEYNIAFKDGRRTSKLEVVGSVGARNTGTTVRFWIHRLEAVA